ncbi:MAG: DUF4115 domain-containing protein [Alphaproteobacteria bacterium]
MAQKSPRQRLKADSLRSAEAPHVGEYLRETREHLGHDLKTIAAELRIREVYLRAIEEGRLEDLPGPTYAGGFMRSYALFLGVNPREMMERYKAAGDSVESRQELVFPAPVPEGRFASPPLVIGGLVVVAVVFGAWLWWANRDATEVAAIPEVPASLEGLIATTGSDGQQPAADSDTTAAGGAAGGGDNVEPAVAAAADTDSASSGGVAVEEAVTGGGSAASVDSDSSATQTGATTISAESPEVAPVVSAAAPPLEAATADTSQNAPGFGASGAIILSASDDAWIEIRDRVGDIVLSRVLSAGESIRVPDNEGYVLTTGNAGGLRVQVGERQSGPLGDTGEVRREIRLAVASLFTQSRN